MPPILPPDAPEWAKRLHVFVEPSAAVSPVAADSTSAAVQVLARIVPLVLDGKDINLSNADAKAVIAELERLFDLEERALNAAHPEGRSE